MYCVYTKIDSDQKYIQVVRKRRDPSLTQGPVVNLSNDLSTVTMDVLLYESSHICKLPYYFRFLYGI